MNTGVTTLAPNSVAIGSGLGDSSWNEALNYEKNQIALANKISEEAKQNAVQNIEKIEEEKNKKDKYLYAIIGFLVLGVIVYEFKIKK